QPIRPRSTAEAVEAVGAVSGGIWLFALSYLLFEAMRGGGGRNRLCFLGVPGGLALLAYLWGRARDEWKGSARRTCCSHLNIRKLNSTCARKCRSIWICYGRWWRLIALPAIPAVWIAWAS